MTCSLLGNRLGLRAPHQYEEKSAPGFRAQQNLLTHLGQTMFLSTVIRGCPRPVWSAAVTAALLFSIGAATGSNAQGKLSSGSGLTNPSLALNLTGISDWSTEMPFLDLMKDSRPWFGSTSTTSGAMTYQQLVDGGYLDANGWLTKMPPGLVSVGTIWDWGNGNDPSSAAAQSREGIYVLDYEGTGTIQLGGDAKVLSSKPGEIIFENTSGNKFWLSITSTDPNGTGDYLHNISVVNEKYEGLYRAGEIFNPDWLSVVNDARELRFMDWMNTNANTGVTDWADRTTISDASWAGGKGVPVEVMVQLANQTGADPWFSMPTGATADYIRQFATYVRDHLAPGLVAHVEYSNEVWNSSFAAYHQMVADSQAAWGVSAPYD